MVRRRVLISTLVPAGLVVVGVITYFVATWPYAPSLESWRGYRQPTHPSLVPSYDGKEPFLLGITRMPGVKMYLDPTDQVITWTILVTGSWEATETDLFIRTVKPGDTIVDAGRTGGTTRSSARAWSGRKARSTRSSRTPGTSRCWRRTSASMG